MLWLKQILKKVFLEDWVMKVVALAITLALWLGVTGLSTPTTQRLTSIPLNLRFSNNIEVTQLPIQEVDLLVTGDKRKLAQINKNDLTVSIDISDVTPGDRVVNLSYDTVSISPVLPTGVRVEVQPNRIPIRIEAVEEKEIPVKAETTGDLPDGYEVYAETITPAKVHVRGPANFIRSLSSVSTERIDMSNRVADFTARQVPVSVSNPKAAVLETVVDVTFRIGEKRVERIYSVPVDGGKRATVVLFGGKSLFENVRADDMHVEIDGNNEPRVLLPPALDGKVEIRSVKIRS